MPLARALMKRSRVVMPLEAHGVRGITCLGRYNFTSARPGLGVHWHQEIEICFLIKGRQIYRVNGEDHHMKGGDIFITLPGERHSSGESPLEKGALYWMTLRLPRRKGGSFLGLQPEQGAALLQALLDVKARLFPGCDTMQGHLDAITSHFQNPVSAYNGLVMTNHAVAFLIEVVECSRRAAPKAKERTLSSVLHRIEQRLDEPLQVTQLAKMSGLSEGHFKTRFKREVGVPPGEFVLRAKVNEAIRRLENKRSTITEIAFDLGFSTSQYFATVFKRYTGETPSSYRAKRH